MNRHLTAAALLLAVAQPAAADPYWSSIATACTPDSLSIQNDRYQSPTDSYVTPQAGKTDPIVLICGVQRNPGAALPNVVSMTYLDATPGAATKVQAQLVRVHRTTGFRATIATVSSNSFTNTVVTKNNSIAFGHVLNFETHYYYVRIDIDRTTAAQNVRGIGVALEPP